MKLLMKAFWLVPKVLRRVLMLASRSLFGAHGRNLYFDPFGLYIYPNIFVGDDVSLGWKPTMFAVQSKIIIGNKVMFGPEVMIMAGNHNWSVVGKYMRDVEVKRPSDDQDVIIEDDVWVGARAIVLKGVRVGRGSVVGAGAIVTKNVPPYCIVAGIPARVVGRRFTLEQALAHEKALFQEKDRFSVAVLQHLAEPQLDAKKAPAQAV
jgi:acetyltransferase-like isoleucine patch superfamily enzyme